MSDQCFNSYLKTFENSLGNESQLVLKEADINLNDTIYSEFIKLNDTIYGEFILSFWLRQEAKVSCVNVCVRPAHYSKEH